MAYKLICEHAAVGLIGSVWSLAFQSRFKERHSSTGVLELLSLGLPSCASPSNVALLVFQEFELADLIAAYLVGTICDAQ